MRILICDDDELMREQFQKYIKSYFEKICTKCPEIVCFPDGESLLADRVYIHFRHFESIHNMQYYLELLPKNFFSNPPQFYRQL